MSSSASSRRGGNDFFLRNSGRVDHADYRDVFRLFDAGELVLLREQLEGGFLHAHAAVKVGVGNGKARKLAQRRSRARRDPLAEVSATAPEVFSVEEGADEPAILFSSRWSDAMRASVSRTRTF